jgi:hypothetical protein
LTYESAEGASDVIDAIGKRARRVVYLSSAGVGSAKEQPGEAIIMFHTELERLIGRPVRFEEVTLDEAIEQMKAAGYPAELVEAVMPAQAEMLDNPEPVNDEVERITGTPARSFREWAVDHAADFR